MATATAKATPGKEQVTATLAKEVSLLSTRQLAGQLLVVGFDGQQQPPSELLASLKQGQRAGVVLFRRNVGTGLAGLQAVASLNQSVISACPEALPPLIAVDEEGGRVARLHEPALKMPPMRRLAEHGGPQLVQRVAQVVGQQLAALGFSMNFAPVVDVDTNRDNPIIGDRAFSRDPNEVIALAEAYCRGLTTGGVQHCLKHFPGHGDTLLDSHLALPRVSQDRKRLDAIELLPFRHMVASADSVMTAHVVFPKLCAANEVAGDENTQLPATLRRTVVHDLLRQQYGFEGLIFSDDLEMKALAEQGMPGPVGVRAIQAGCDVLLVCSNTAMQKQVFASLVEAIESKNDFRSLAEKAAIRSLTLRRRKAPQTASAEELKRVVREVVAPLQTELARLI